MAAETDSDDLALEEVAFFSFEVRIRANVFLQITCEHVLYSSGGIDLVGSDYRQFLPVSIEEVSGYPVGHLVDACSFGLDFWWKLSLFSSFC